MQYYKNSGIKQKVIDEIIQIAVQCEVHRVILFGSRSRGDYKDRSDIDLAVSGGNITKFSLDVDEVTSTLLKYDIVNLDGSVQQELLDSIEGEGKVIVNAK